MNTAMSLTTKSLNDDLHRATAEAERVWPLLSGSNIFLTGGTGFIGTWILELLHYAISLGKLNLSVSILSRNPESFLKKVPHFEGFKPFKFIQGDLLNARLPQDEYTHLIHAATDASAHLNEQNPLLMFNTTVLGTAKVLEFARECRIKKILFLSSGAVYGAQPWEINQVSEKSTSAPLCTEARNAYAEGKRGAEMLCAIYGRQFGLDIVTARIFAILGPYIRLDTHFAAGNFIRDAIARREIIINSDGRPCRSYLYISDLVVWLLTMLVQAKAGTTYNVGSDHSISIKELAELTSNVLGGVGVRILGKTDSGWNPGRYVPDTSLIRKDFALVETVSLTEAIKKTAAWNGWRSQS